MRIASVLLLAVLVLGAVRFARYDWTGTSLTRYPMRSERVVNHRCTERIGPYTTESGRVVAPIAVDQMQYLSMIERFRGVPLADLQVTCMYSPFAERVGTPFVASLLPFEEGLALGATNLAFMVGALCLTLAAMRREGYEARVVFVAGALFAIGWNTLMFSSALLVESAPVMLVAAAWYLMVRRRWWWVVPLMVVAILFKETTIIVVPAMFADAWVRRGERVAKRVLVASVMTAVLGVTTLLTVGPLMGWSQAAWPADVSISVLAANLDLFGLVVLAVGVGPLLVPTLLWWVQRRRRLGLLAATIDPRIIGVLGGLGLLAWSALTADLSPRHFWPAFPFAASATAAWLSNSPWLDRVNRLPLPSALLGEAVPPLQTDGVGRVHG